MNENNALLKEQAGSLEAKLHRAEQRAKELAQLQVENEVCDLSFFYLSFSVLRSLIIFLKS